jgi:hypothetical protein
VVKTKTSLLPLPCFLLALLTFTLNMLGKMRKISPPNLDSLIKQRAKLTAVMESRERS